MVWVATLVAKRNGTRPCLRHVLLTHANMSRPNIHEPVQSHDAFLGVYQPVSLVQFVYTRAPLFGASPYLSLVLSLIAIMAHVLVTRYHISIGRVLTYMEKVLSVISQHLKKTKKPQDSMIFHERNLSFNAHNVMAYRDVCCEEQLCFQHYDSLMLLNGQLLSDIHLR